MLGNNAAISLCTDNPPTPESKIIMRGGVFFAEIVSAEVVKALSVYSVNHLMWSFYH
jgi:hypothetical protein